MAAKRPTILQVIPNLDTGGAELTTIEVAGAIRAAGGRALVATEGGRMADRLLAAGGEIVSLPMATKNPLRILSNAGALARLVRAEGVDLVHARSRAPAWSALVAARRCRIPFVTTYHGAYSEKGRVKNFYNSVMARSDVVIANSRYTADLVRARYGTPGERIQIVYRGVDFARFDADRIPAQRIAALRASWGVAPGTRVVLHAARLTAWKGQPDVIETAARLAARFPDVVFVLAGDAQGREGYRADLVARIARHGLGERVRLVGHVDDIAAAFAAAHAAIVASVEPEAFGRAGAEAQAMGCPVVSTDIGAPPETVLAPPRVAAEARTGWLVPPGDVAAYEAALAEALTLSPEARAAMGARARRHVRESFSVESLQARTLAVYDRLLGTDLARRFAATLEG